MRRRLLSFSLALLAALPCVLRAEPLNRIVLRINDKIATMYDFEQRRQELVRDVSRRTMDEDERQRLLEQAPEIVYKDLFQDLLLESRAHQLAIEISDAQIDAAIAQMKQNFGLKTDADFLAALAQSGLTQEQLRDQLRTQLQVREVMEKEVRSRIKVDEEDLRRYYRKNLEQFRLPEQFHLREVVVLDEGGLATPEERQKAAEEIRQAVIGGKTLVEATAEDQKKGITSNEIDLGWVSPGDLDPALEAAAWKLKPGEISEPVAGRGGLHLMVAAEHRESRVPPFSEVSSVIQTREQDRVYNVEVAKYLAELEQKSLVVADPPPEAAGFRSLMAKPQPEPNDLDMVGAAGAAPAKDSTDGKDAEGKSGSKDGDSTAAPKAPSTDAPPPPPGR
jgi:peptidyl-prolyl cis-trans isomerase SurA